MPADRKYEAGPSKPKRYVLPPVAGAGDEADIHGRPQDELDDNEEDDAEEGGPVQGLTLKRKTKSKTKSPGVVYISRLPPGMTPHKVRHLMAKWGEVGKVYAQARDATVGYNPDHHKKKDRRHKSADFTEAWVEFLDKSVAKTVAQMLNAQVIGGKKGDRWSDDIWTMKYLSGFKWEMLGEQVAYERQVHQSRMRTEMQKAKTEQNAYLKNVELARVLKKREAKAPAAAEGKEEKHKRTYKQREAADRAHGLEAKGMENVLGSLF